ncbi:MAG: GGDEF domain-containing protein, partial [Aeromicrobium sp.]
GILITSMEAEVPEGRRNKTVNLTAFALVTSLAAAVIAVTGLIDVLTRSANISIGWTVLVSAAAAGAAALPFMLGERFPPALGLGACWLFAVVTALQTAQSENTLMAVNNLVLYPMVSCYLGWFFEHRTARATVAATFLLSASGLWISGLIDVFTTWANLALASFFCLEAALYLRAKLDRQIESDPLTAALNRNGLTARLSRELAGAVRTGKPLSVAIIDLDGFKAINDQFGHAAGDRMLIAMVSQLKDAARERDAVARLGGDEFVLLLPNTPQAQAFHTLERLQKDSAMPWTYGLVQALAHENGEEVIARADDDLYLHKKHRRPTTPSDPTS